MVIMAITLINLFICIVCAEKVNSILFLLILLLQIAKTRFKHGFDSNYDPGEQYFIKPK